MIPAHKVYINDRPLWFNGIYDKNKMIPDGMEVLSSETHSLEEVVHMLEHSKSKGIVFLSENPEQSWKSFVYPYTLIEAAGGLVKNEKGEYLFIFRRGKWDLPKGKAEYDESIAETAYREVQEECGLKVLELKEELCKTFHTYSEKGKHILKKTHWFKMDSLSTEKLIPQTEEDITKIKWLNAEEIREKVVGDTFGSVREILGLVGI